MFPGKKSITNFYHFSPLIQNGKQIESILSMEQVGTMYQIMCFPNSGTTTIVIFDALAAVGVTCFLYVQEKNYLNLALNNGVLFVFDE
jgi:hypothetical protein